MPRFCEVFEKRFNVFTFPIKSVRYWQAAFYRLKPTFRGNVSFNYVNPSLFILNARNSVFDLKMARPENIFKNVTKIKHSRFLTFGALFAVFTFVLINRFN